MQIAEVFNQLKEAYLLISGQLDDQPDIIINQAASDLLKEDIGSIKTSILWKEVLLPLFQRNTPPFEDNFFYQGKYFSISTSAINAGDSTLVSAYIRRAIIPEDNTLNIFDIVDNLGAYVFCKDANYQYTFANKQVCELFALTREQVIGQNDIALFGEEAGKRLIEEYDHNVIEKGQTQTNEEVLYIESLDEYRTYLAVKKPLHDSKGNICGLFGISTDISKLKRIQSQLRENEQQLRTILDNVGAYIYIKDKDRRFRYINKLTEQLFGKSSDEVVGLNNIELLGPEQGEEFDSTDRQVFESGKKLSCLETFNTPEETFFYWSVKIPLQNELGEVDHYIGISTDITEQKNLEAQVRQTNLELELKIEEINCLKDKLQNQATHDALTGLYNRRYLEEHSPLCFTDPARGPTSLLMVDIDNFKLINDSFGHQAGDKALKLLAAVLKAECRSNDLICRYGGDEFIIVLPQTPENVAIIKAEWIRKNFQLEITNLLPEAKSSISIGLATSPENADSFERLYRAADKALYVAKSKGRNCCVSASNPI